MSASVCNDVNSILHDYICVLGNEMANMCTPYHECVLSVCVSMMLCGTEKSHRYQGGFICFVPQM